MKTLGPFITRQHAADTTLHWCRIYLSGHHQAAVWSIEYAPFHSSEPAPSAWMAQRPAPQLLHAFDPSRNTYFSLQITTEHTLLRFRATGIQHQEKPLFQVEQAQHASFIPTVTDFDIASEPYQITKIQLDADDGTLKANIKAQYQAMLPPSPWQDESQDIPAANTFPVHLRDLWSTNGFFLAWHELKSSASTPTIYCHALIAIIAKPEKRAASQAICDADNLSAEITQVKRYLADTSRYPEDTPLNDALFHETQQALMHELHRYAQKLNEAVRPTLSDEDRLSLPAAIDAYLSTKRYSSTNAELIASMLFCLMSAQYNLAATLESLNQLNTLLTGLLSHDPAYAEVYQYLEEQYSAQYPTFSLSDALQTNQKIITDKKADVLRQSIQHTKQSIQTPEALPANIIEYLTNAEDAGLALACCDSIAEKHALIDALRLDDVNSPFLQTMVDLGLITRALTKASKIYLFNKRTPAEWAALIKTPEHLTHLDFIFAAPQKKGIFAANPAYIASLIFSSEALTANLLTLHMSELRALLPHIPDDVRSHWLQTPKRLAAFLTLSTQKVAYQNNITRILKAIPSPYRVTALIQSDDAEEKMTPLLRANVCLVHDFFDLLSEEEWQLVLKQVKPMMKVLLHFKALGDREQHYVAVTLLKILNPRCYRYLIDGSPATLDLPEHDTFEQLKRQIIQAFPRKRRDKGFFTAATTSTTVFPNTAALQRAKDPEALRNALIEIYCLTTATGTEKGVIHACHVIHQYETQAAEKDAAHQTGPHKRMKI